MSTNASRLPGLAVAGSTGLFAIALAAGIRSATGEIPVGSALLAILAGLIFASPLGSREALQPGLKLAIGPVLKLGVMLIGLRLSLTELGTLGLEVAGLVIGVILAGLMLMAPAGRLLGLGPRLTALLGVGTAICGASAIAATAPGVRARADETAYAIACVALFGLIATLAWPWLFEAVLGDPHRVGIALGAAIHDTAQVTGAALMHEQIHAVSGSLESATVTKLLRNLGMLVVIPLVIAWVNRADNQAGGRMPAFPLFVLGFVALSALRTLGDALFSADAETWQVFLGLADQASTILFATALAALGLSIRVAALRALGWQAAAAALAVTVLIAGLVLGWLALPG